MQNFNELILKANKISTDIEDYQDTVNKEGSVVYAYVFKLVKELSDKFGITSTLYQTHFNRFGISIETTYEGHEIQMDISMDTTEKELNEVFLFKFLIQDEDAQNIYKSIAALLTRIQCSKLDELDTSMYVGSTEYENLTWKEVSKNQSSMESAASSIKWAIVELKDIKLDFVNLFNATLRSIGHSSFSISDDLAISFKGLFFSNQLPFDNEKGFIIDNEHCLFDKDRIDANDTYGILYLFSKLLDKGMYDALIDMQNIARSHSIDCDSFDEMNKFRSERHERDRYNDFNIGDLI